MGSEGFFRFPSPHSLVGSDGFVPMSIVTLSQSVAHIFFCMGKKIKPVTEVGTEVGAEVGEGVKKNPTQIWPYLCEILLNSFPNEPPIRDPYV